MKFKTYCCRHLWPVVQCGTYDGDFMCPDRLYDLEYEQDQLWDEFREFIAVGEMDFNRFKTAMAGEILRIFQTENPLEKFGVKVVDVSIDSPREYNFRTDWAEPEIEVPDTFILDTMKWIKESATRTKIAKKWIQDHWTSYDGWWSCMPESWDELHEWIGRDDPYYRDVLAGGLLGILTKIDQPDLLGADDYNVLPFTDTLVERMEGNYSPGDFYPIYQPNKILRKYSLDSELRIDDNEEDLSKVLEKLDGGVEWRLDELAYADQFGDDEAKERAKASLVKELKEANIRRLQQDAKEDA